MTKTQRMVGMFLSAAVIVGAVSYGANKLAEEEREEQFLSGVPGAEGVPVDGEGNTVIVNNGHQGGIFSGFFGPFGPFGPFGYFSGRSSGYNQGYTSGVSSGTPGNVKSPTSGTTTVTPESNPGVVGTSPWGKPSTGTSSSSSFSSSSKSSSGISSGISGSSHGGIGSSGGTSIS